jgi:hypothetical protein
MEINNEFSFRSQSKNLLLFSGLLDRLSMLLPVDCTNPHSNKMNFSNFQLPFPEILVVFFFGFEFFAQLIDSKFSNYL